MVYANLKAEIVKSNIPIKRIAKWMNISLESLKEKIHCKQDFTLSEVMIILEVFPQLSFEYLFTKV